MGIYSRVLCAVALIAKREFGSTIWNTCFTSKYEKKKCIIFMRVKTITKFQPNEWNRSFIITVNLGGSIFLPTSIRLCELSRTDILYRNTIRSNKRIDRYQIWLYYTKHDRRHKNLKLILTDVQFFFIYTKAARPSLWGPVAIYSTRATARVLSPEGRYVVYPVGSHWYSFHLLG